MSRRIPPSMDEADTLLPIEVPKTSLPVHRLYDEGLASKVTETARHVMKLTQEEYDNFVEVCKNPPKASEQLKQLFRKYKGKNV